jgi:hypothetical protein
MKYMLLVCNKVQDDQSSVFGFNENLVIIV